MKPSTECAEEFYKYLRRRGISKKNVFRKLDSWDFREILDFVLEAYLTLRMRPEETESIFTFTANSGLSGAPFPCESIICRLNKLDSVARFAALYADKVFIENPFERYLSSESVYDPTTKTTMLAGDILGLLYLRPLFQAGLLSIRHNINLLCSNCLAEVEALEQKVSKQLDRARKQLQKRYLREVQVHILKEDDEVFLRYTGPEHLIEHGILDLIGPLQLPQSLREKCSSIGAHKLTRREIAEYDLTSWFVYAIVKDIFQQNIHVCRHGTQYLTDREIDLDIATSIGKPDVVKTSRSLLAGLSHSIPTIENIHLDKLIHLRQKEGEAFEVYRDALHRVLNQAQALEPDEMRVLIDDEIRPEIHKIERTITTTKRLLVNSLKRDVLVSAGYVAIGLFSGFLSPKAADIAIALGGHSGVKSIAEKIPQLRRDPAKVLENPYYFLWKLQKKTKKQW